MATSSNQFVSISPSPGKILVSWGYTTFYKKEDDGGFSCYINAFDIHFNAKALGDIEGKSKAILSMYFDHFFIHNQKNALKLVALQLHKLGFKAQNDMVTMRELVNNHRIPAKFKSSTINAPSEFVGASKVDHVSEMELAG